MGNWKGWQFSETQDFWGVVAPCEQVIQIYEENDAFLNTLSDYVKDGINSDDSTIVIATKEHLASLEGRLTNDGINVNSLISEDLYLPLDAEETLLKFMRNDWPDSALFFQMVSGLLQRTFQKNRSVRVFGEMVALLWARGNNDAAVQLQHLWNQFCNQDGDITVFFAYPKSGFTSDVENSIRHIFVVDSKLISGQNSGEKGILYKNLRGTFPK